MKPIDIIILFSTTISFSESKKPRPLKSPLGGSGGREIVELDKFLPKYEFHEVHSVTTNASPDRAYTAAKELLPSELSPLVYLMFTIRELPAKLIGKSYTKKESAKPFLTQLLD